MKQKRMIWVLLTVILCVGIVFQPMSGLAATKRSTYSIFSTEFKLLSPDDVGSITPTVYSSLRFKNSGDDRGFDINDGYLSADKIQKQSGKREYGLYLKFTPGRADNGAKIERIDFVISDPDDNIILNAGFDTEVVCEYGYYWYWDFFSLDDLFTDLASQTTGIPVGLYTLDIYFNSHWGGTTHFRVKK